MTVSGWVGVRNDEPGTATAGVAAVTPGVDGGGAGRAARGDWAQRAPRCRATAGPRLSGARQQGPWRRLSAGRGRGAAAAAARSRRGGGDGGVPAAGRGRQRGRRRRIGPARTEQARSGDALAAAVPGRRRARSDGDTAVELLGLTRRTRGVDDVGTSVPRSRTRHDRLRVAGRRRDATTAGALSTGDDRQALVFAGLRPGPAGLAQPAAGPDDQCSCTWQHIRGPAGAPRGGGRWALPPPPPPP